MRTTRPWKCATCGLETRGYGIYSHRRKCKSFEERLHAEIDAHERSEASRLWNHVNGEMAEHLGLDSDKNTFGDKASCRCIAKQYLWLADHAAKFISDRITAEDWKRIRRLLGSNARVPFASNRGTALVHEALESHFNRVAQS